MLHFQQIQYWRLNWEGKKIPWGWDNSTESKLKKNNEAQFLNNLILKDEIEKKKLQRKD
jgi:hypothetical protein